MATTSSATVKVVTSLTASTTGSTVTREPASPMSFTLSSKYRIEKQVRSIAASGTLTVTKADEGLTTINLMQVTCKSAGKAFNIQFDGDVTGQTYNAPSVTEEAFTLSTGDFTTMVITNPDSVNAIDIEMAFFQKD